MILSYSLTQHNPHLTTSHSLKRTLSAIESNPYARDKRIRENDFAVEERNAGWREVDTRKECFLLPALPPAPTFPEINARRCSRLSEIFLRFVDEDVVSKLIDSFTAEDLMLGYRNKAHGTTRRMVVTPQLIYKVFAVHIRIIGLQAQPNESSVRKPLRKALDESREHFQHRCPSIDYLEKMTSIMQFGGDWTEILSLKFQSVISRLGQFVAGDENIFQFTGKSEGVRLVKSQPDQRGLWLHELCCSLSCGLPYMLHLRLQHNNVPGQLNTEVSDNVRRWGHVIKSIGGTDESHRDQKCILAFSSCIMDEETRRYLREERLPYAASAQDVQSNADLVFVLENTIDEHRAIYNESSEELFVYNYDGKKGARKKYLLSFGLIRSEDSTEINRHLEVIPGYSVYDSMLETCATFNSGLGGKSWPHRRGGGRCAGSAGSVHDFLFACLLQNTCNLHSDLGRATERAISFKEKCIALSDQILDYADKL